MRWMKFVGNKHIIAYLIFLITGVCVQLIEIPLLFGLSISLIPIWYLAMSRLFGLVHAFIALACFSSVAYFTHIHFPVILFGFLQLIIIGGLYQRKGKDLFTWSFLYSIFILVTYFVVVFFIDAEIIGPVTNFYILKNIINILIASLLADIVSDYLPYVPWVRHFLAKQRRLYFGQIISHMIMIAAVIPVLIIIWLNSSMIEEELLQSYEDALIELDERLNERVAEMDANEIQYFELDADLEKARVKALLEPYINDNQKSVIILDEKGDEWLTVTNGLPDDNIIQTLQNGYTQSIHENGYIWVPSDDASVFHWFQGYYIGSSHFLNKQVMLLIPLSNIMIDVTDNTQIYLIFAMVVLFVALLFGMITNHILSKSLRFLTDLTSDLPNKLKEQHFKWPDTRIDEFSRLGDNIKIVAIQFQKMMKEESKQNELLIEKTNQLIESETRLYELAHFDNLTKLPNRYSFYEDMNQIIEGDDFQEDPFAILFIDLDKFKQVNDTLGHSGGDELLKGVAHRLKQFEQDYPSIQMYRLAGDEFIAIVRLSDKQSVQNIRHVLINDINRPISLFDTQIQLTASIGISFYPDDGTTVDGILHQADTLMYEQKQITHQELEKGEEHEQ
ncbi:hypothetical protein J416_03021 [Gracilibacillus halophilus YIM-C55.5]|uniref:GGDEF domain-containing protein n=1 Tax=Gracilibacillus halophilus YIM-C55.5 TaxID=1308866 RepID=N4WXT8_9BACI|nr:GGDEF domain-containing protein [Gracilibacillus halophilus]ENH97891.1 hypothetical protein J416_03021 [Gracilibacillus halophilus YIM-C55.5]